MTRGQSVSAVQARTAAPLSVALNQKQITDRVITCIDEALDRCARERDFNEPPGLPQDQQALFYFAVGQTLDVVSKQLAKLVLMDNIVEDFLTSRLSQPLRLNW